MSIRDDLYSAALKAAALIDRAGISDPGDRQSVYDKAIAVEAGNLSDNHINRGILLKEFPAFLALVDFAGRDMVGNTLQRMRELFSDMHSNAPMRAVFFELLTIPEVMSARVNSGSGTYGAAVAGIGGDRASGGAKPEPA